ncbi:MAG: hypothetical protein ABIP94_15615 [Planctomycetota bacterium]
MSSFAITTSRISCVLATTALLTAQGSYESEFDGLTASASGTALAGRDGFQVPLTTPPSVDGAIYTYGGNALGIPTMSSGGSNFLGLDGTTGPAQIERLVNIPFDCHTHIEFDFCVRYVGAGAPSGIIGGFSLQPAGSARSAHLIARWPANAASPPTTWNADLIVGPNAAGTAIQVPDTHFQNLAVNTWYRWGCSLHAAGGEYELLVIDDLAGNRVLFVPPAGTMMVNALGPAPSSFRLGAVGTGCLCAFDRMSVAYHGTYEPYGLGCAGTLGIPVLSALNGSRPVLSTTFQAQLAGLPLNVGLMAWGFSDTLWGTVPLPFDLASIGMPGCPLQLDPVNLDLLLGASGSALWSAAIPSSSTFMGAEFFTQGVSLDPTANAAGLVLSNAARACVGR